MIASAILNTMKNLNPHELRKVAVEAAVAPVTVRRFITGQPIRSRCESRIREAIARLNIIVERGAPAGAGE